MSSHHIIEATARNQTGTGASRSCRRNGIVPGIVYGEKKDPVTIAVDHKMIKKEIQSGSFFSRVFDLVIDQKKETVIAKDIQFHPVTDNILHIDFQRVGAKSIVHVYVPIAFINEDKAPGIKRGGVLNHILHTIEVIAPADKIPESLEFDMTGCELNQTIHTDVLKLPTGVKIAHPQRDHTIATIIAPSGLKEDASSAEAPTEAEPS